MHLYRKLEWKYVNVQALTTCRVRVPPTQPAPMRCSGAHGSMIYSGTVTSEPPDLSTQPILIQHMAQYLCHVLPCMPPLDFLKDKLLRF
jgi:hypothetical protein